MNCAYKNYLYIYNIKLMEENILLIKKKNPSNMFFVLLILKNFFINSLKLFFRTKTVFQNSVPKQDLIFQFSMLTYHCFKCTTTSKLVKLIA